MAEIIGIPGKTIAAAYSGKSRPKYTNFMKMLHGARDICAKEILSPGSQQASIDGLDEAGFQGHWNSEWITIHREKSQLMIAAVVQNLEQLIHLARGSNSVGAVSETGSTLSEIQRKQLISVLETALAMLKSPMVEVGFLRRLKSWLGNIAVKSAERGVDAAIGTAAHSGFDALESLVRKLGSD